MSKIDDMGWHLGDDFPCDLPAEAAATPMAMFLGWVIDNHKESHELIEVIGNEELEMFRRRELPLNSLILNTAEKLYDDYFNDEAKKFAKAYYEHLYFDDYKKLLDRPDESLYSMPASWEKYELVKKRIEQRYKEWKNKKLPQNKPSQSLMSSFFFAALMGFLNIIIFCMRGIWYIAAFLYHSFRAFFHLLISPFHKKK